MPATLVLLALGLLGSILMFAGDMLLYFTPGAYDMDGTLRPYMRIMRDVPAGRVRIGGALGPVAAFLYVLGFAGLALVAAVVLGQTVFPAWLVVLTPLVTSFLGLVWMRVPQPARCVLFGGWSNLVFTIMFAAMLVCKLAG